LEYKKRIKLVDFNNLELLRENLAKERNDLMKKKEQCIEHLGKTINNKENTVENIFPKSINNNTMKIKTL
jgi:hypothetical protein